MQAAAAGQLPVPIPQPSKMPAYDVPGKHLSFDEKPFTDRLQAVEESRLAALHYSTGLTVNTPQEHQGILVGDDDAMATKQRKFRLGRRNSAKSAQPPPPTSAATEERKPSWSRKFSIRRRKQAPQQHPAAERAAPPLTPAPAPAVQSGVPPPVPSPVAVHNGGGGGDEDEDTVVGAPTLVPDVSSPRSQVRHYLETLGHPAGAAEAVVLAFTEAEYAPDEWMPELQDMQTGNTLSNFVELCSKALPDLHAKATQVQATWRGFYARQSEPRCRAAASAIATRATYSNVVESYCPLPVVAPTSVAQSPADEVCVDDSTNCSAVGKDSDAKRPDTKVVRLSFAFVTASEKLDLVLSPSTPGHAARVSREIIEDRRRSSMIAHSVVCQAGGARDHVGMCRDEIVVFASDVVKMATSKLSSSTGPIWVNPTWESGDPERVDEC